MKTRDLLSGKNTNNLGYISAFFSAALFGSISTLAKPTVSNVEPLLLAGIVSLVAAAAFTPIAGRKRIKLDRREFGILGLVALLGAVLAPSFYFFGLQSTSASDATILSNSEIVFTVILAILFFKEKIRRTGYFSIGLVFTGVVLVTINTDFSSNVLDFANVGNLFIILTMFCWALDNNLSKILTKTIDVSRIVHLKSLLGGVVLVGIVLLLGIPISVSEESWINIILLGIIGIAAPMFLFYYAIKNIGAVKTILIFSTSSIFGVVYAFIFLQEQIQYHQIIAMGIMVFGIMLLRKENTHTTD
ncbi:EamA/RhaT family transporter [Nitrosopumilus sp. b1]|uniref:DMT family transporter n=1 Tax=Nitrosopumilus sp. b1 TaxID=2109907 RepID=UPI0015F46B23|nr:DMT family transporter [Nitrosopumilus sp. b1]KAF6242992.1 EamA/RhaT family transporter [Nitrosopumilus sp. b1]